MKNFKGLIGFILVVLILGCFVGCATEKAEKLGDTSFSIILPEGYKLTENEDLDEDQIAYYYKDDNSVDFDVYAWAKENYVLKEEAEYYATEYNSTVNEFSVNGIDGYLYISNELYDEVNWVVYNYMFEDDNNFVELCFWTDNSEEELVVVNSIISTLKKE